MVFSSDSSEHTDWIEDTDARVAIPRSQRPSRYRGCVSKSVNNEPEPGTREEAEDVSSYLPSPWLLQTESTMNPFLPQIGDTVRFQTLPARWVTDTSCSRWCIAGKAMNNISTKCYWKTSIKSRQSVFLGSDFSSEQAIVINILTNTSAIVMFCSLMNYARY